MSDGVVIDNLKENVTDEEVKLILAASCPDENLDDVKINPLGSTKSKLITGVESSLLQTLVNNVNKTRIDGKQIHCHFHIPATPPKSKESEVPDVPASVVSEPVAVETIVNAEEPPKVEDRPQIPGLPETERTKPKSNRKPRNRTRKPRKSGEPKKVKVVKNLKSDDFLKSPKETKKQM